MRYAAYGSNLHPVRLADRLPSARLCGVGFLPDWSLCFNKRSRDGSGKCTILAGDDGVHFAVFEISDADKLALDRIEGLGLGYANISLHIAGFGNCSSYIADPAYVEDGLLPYDWYKALVLAGARLHRFPDPYIARIESTPSIPDADAVRSGLQWQTVDKVRSAR